MPVVQKSHTCCCLQRNRLSDSIRERKKMVGRETIVFTTTLGSGQAAKRDNGFVVLFFSQTRSKAALNNLPSSAFYGHFMEANSLF